MIRHTENFGIVRTIYLGFFRHIQGQSAIFSHGQAYWGALKDIQASSGIIEAYWAIFRTLYNPCANNRRAVAVGEQGGGGSWWVKKVLPVQFWDSKRCPYFGNNKGPDCVHLWIKFLSYSRCCFNSI